MHNLHKYFAVPLKYVGLSITVFFGMLFLSVYIDTSAGSVKVCLLSNKLLHFFSFKTGLLMHD